MFDLSLFHSSVIKEVLTVLREIVFFALSDKTYDKAFVCFKIS